MEMWQVKWEEHIKTLSLHLCLTQAEQREMNLMVTDLAVLNLRVSGMVSFFSLTRPQALLSLPQTFGPVKSFPLKTSQCVLQREARSP
jgi:hypothetical protein